MFATYLSILRRRRWSIIGAAAILAPMGFFALTYGAVEYQSEAGLLLGTNRAVDGVLGQGSGFEEPERRMATELEIFRGRTVAVQAAERLAEQGWNESPESLSERIEAAPRGFSRAIEVVGTDTEPQRAQELTDAFVNAYLDYRIHRQAAELEAIETDLQERLETANDELRQLDAQLAAGEEVNASREVALTRYQTTAGWLEEVRLLQAGAGSGIEILSPATTPDEPNRALPPVVAGGVAIIGGLLLAAGLALLLDLIRDAVRTREEAERLVPAPVLAEMPRAAKGSGELVRVLNDPGHPTMAAARALRLRLEAWSEQGLPERVLVAGVTSETDDSLLVGAALAAACGRAGHRTLLVADPSSNLRMPAIPAFDPGIAPGDVRHPAAPAARMTALAGLWSAPATARRRGLGRERDVGLFDGFATGPALDALAAHFDIIVIVPPADAGMFELISIRRLVETFVLVCSLGQTPGRPLRQVVHTMQQQQAIIDGLVLTTAQQSDRRPEHSAPSGSDARDRTTPAIEPAR